MRASRHRFLEILKADDPLATESFRRLRERVAAGDAPELREFLIALNHAMTGHVGREDGAQAAGPVALCLAVVEANPELTMSALGDLLSNTTLQFQDPLVSETLESAGEAPALFSLLTEVAESEGHLLRFRVRALEALVTKSREEADVDTVWLDAQPTFRFLNAVLDELDKGQLDGFGDAHVRWAAGLRALTRPTGGAQEAQILEAVADALEALASAATDRETIRRVLRVLRANTPLPSWHPVHGVPPGRGPAGSVSALIADKAIQAVLGAAAARWRGETRNVAPRGTRPELELWPFNERVLEAALMDPAQPARARAMAAGLLRVLVHSSPAVRLSPRAEVYAELFLAPYARPSGVPGELEGLQRFASGEQLDLLLDALGDGCDEIRRGAAEACELIARQQPAGFEPRHYTKLLPLLSDEDPGLRVSTMRIFQALAGFRSRRVAKVVDDISARLYADEEPHADDERARRDLEMAMGITMDRLVDDVEQLQQEVHALETRRRELLDYLEGQAMRVGEEIHHEVLNTLTSYLATAIDEQDYRESKSRLDNVIAELRRIMNNLYPRDLETEGFLQTIRNRLRDAKAQMQRRTPGCTLELDCPPGITDDTIAEWMRDASHLVLLYRIVLEAIINARKHAGGTSIVVSVRRPAPGRLEIAVQDNGSGAGGPFGENTGMALMRRRAEEIGAQIGYQPGTGGGTTVVVRLSRPDLEPEVSSSNGGRAAAAGP